MHLVHVHTKVKSVTSKYIIHKTHNNIEVPFVERLVLVQIHIVPPQVSSNIHLFRFKLR
jgi:hypothetical protein